MENETKIVQILTNEWIGKTGDKMQDIVGLGEDSNMYRWHRGSGKWILWIIQS
jgi:hypothetical protein